MSGMFYKHHLQNRKESLGHVSFNKFSIPTEAVCYVGWLVGWVLMCINFCSLFNANSSYAYIKYILFLSL